MLCPLQCSYDIQLLTGYGVCIADVTFGFSTSKGGEMTSLLGGLIPVSPTVTQLCGLPFPSMEMRTVTVTCQPPSALGSVQGICPTRQVPFPFPAPGVLILRFELSIQKDNLTTGRRAFDSSTSRYLPSPCSTFCTKGR